jgi:hypothetical protein
MVVWSALYIYIYIYISVCNNDHRKIQPGTGISMSLTHGSGFEASLAMHMRNRALVSASLVPTKTHPPDTCRLRGNT